PNTCSFKACSPPTLPFHTVGTGYCWLRVPVQPRATTSFLLRRERFSIISDDFSTGARHQGGKDTEVHVGREEVDGAVVKHHVGPGRMEGVDLAVVRAIQSAGTGNEPARVRPVDAERAVGIRPAALKGIGVDGIESSARLVQGG